jgi:hypothetical protein
MDENYTTSELTKREKAILCGLFLSRCNLVGLDRLGFKSFKEAYNILGLAVGVKPASIKNYRDELDPLFPNPRQGWHRRPLREHCEKIYELYKSVQIDEFVSLLARITGCDFSSDEENGGSPDKIFNAKRLLTGKAAEKYFLSNYGKEKDFQNGLLADVSLTGCGYDFRIQNDLEDSFLAVEVKGMSGLKGTISLTEKEHRVAGSMGRQYYLYIVRNFEESPFSTNIADPINADLKFEKRERKIIQITWTTSI